MQLARGDKNLHVLRGVRSPTLVIGVPCPTLILVNYVRGVRSPTLLYALRNGLKSMQTFQRLMGGMNRR